MEKLKNWFSNLKTKIAKLACKLWAKFHKIPKQTREDMVVAPAAYAASVFLMRKAFKASFTRYNARLHMGGVKYFGKNVIGSIPDSDGWSLFFKEVGLWSLTMTAFLVYMQAMDRLEKAVNSKIEAWVRSKSRNFAKKTDSIVEE